jgi:hypothetical protein
MDKMQEEFELNVYDFHCFRNVALNYARNSRDCIIVGFTTTSTISAYHHFSYEFEPCSWRGLLDTTLCDKVCLWLATGQWFSSGTSVSSTNKNECHHITVPVFIYCIRSLEHYVAYNIYIICIFLLCTIKYCFYWSILQNCLPFQSTWVHPRCLVTCFSIFSFICNVF